MNERLHNALMLLINEMRDMRAATADVRDQLRSLEVMVSQIRNLVVQDHEDFSNRLQSAEGSLYDIQRHESQTLKPR